MNWHQRKRTERVQISNTIINLLNQLDIPQHQKDELKMLVLQML